MPVDAAHFERHALANNLVQVGRHGNLWAEIPMIVPKSEHTPNTPVASDPLGGLGRSFASSLLQIIRPGEDTRVGIMGLWTGSVHWAMSRSFQLRIRCIAKVLNARGVSFAAGNRSTVRLNDQSRRFREHQAHPARGQPPKNTRLPDRR
jgi:hypothetical protein